jgi:superfamily II DNA or RNA helicase
MNHDPFKNRLRQVQADRDLTNQFKSERLSGSDLSKEQWPAQIDNAALNILDGIAIGTCHEVNDIGATIGTENFPDATGPFYLEGMQALAGPESPAASAVSRYDPIRLAKFGLTLNEFRDKLDETTESLDIDRALEAILEKDGTTTGADSEEVPAGLPDLRDASSASELILRLFSDPELEAYGTDLIRKVTSRTATRDQLLEILDRPQMTTPLWEHQREALREWYHGDQTGYVDMATATGKTVLGIAAIAVRFGQLHPEDQALVTRDSELHNGGHDRVSPRSKPRVLIVASNKVILDQWRREFDTHLDIPRARTQPSTVDGRTRIELSWAKLEFDTAPALLERDVIEPTDLTILDEAHQYSRGGQGASRRWRDLFADLVENSDAVLAMSGSVDEGWQGDSAAKDALETHLDRRKRYTLSEARQDGVIADFEWTVHYGPVPADGDDDIAAQTRITTKYHDTTTGALDTDTLGITLPEDQPNDFPTYSDIRSFVQSDAGRQLRDESDRFDLFGAAIQTRRPLVWNLSPTHEGIASLLDDHASQQCVVLVQSYEGGIDLGNHLREEHNVGDIIVLKGREDDRTAKIQRFNETPGATIVGPGRLLGTGVDMPDAEVAVNVAKGGVTAELVQRIGRVLRNPDGTKEASFYHVVPQPQDADAVVPAEDGRQLLARAAEFQALGDTIDESPSFTTVDTLRPLISELERAGAVHLTDYPTLIEGVDSDQVRTRLETLRTAIGDRATDDEPILLGTNPWTGGTGRPESGPSDRDIEIEIDPSASPDREMPELSDADRAEIASLERLACDNTANETAETMRLTAVQRLATFGRGALEALNRVADESNCGNEGVRAAAEEAIKEILLADAETK